MTMCGNRSTFNNDGNSWHMCQLLLNNNLPVTIPNQTKTLQSCNGQFLPNMHYLYSICIGRCQEQLHGTTPAFLIFYKLSTKLSRKFVNKSEGLKKGLIMSTNLNFRLSNFWKFATKFPFPGAKIFFPTNGSLVLEWY